MKRTLIILFSLCLVGTALADKRPMTTDDALNMVNVGNALISPDGNWVFFSKSELNWEKNKRDTKYFMISTSGGEAFQYIGEAGGSSFEFSPDGKFLSLKRAVEKKSQIFLMPTSGGEAVQLTEHKESVGSYLWAPDGTKIYFTADKAFSKEEEKKIKDGEDIIFVD
jgi:Tol biopolymer transport system component